MRKLLYTLIASAAALSLVVPAEAAPKRHHKRHAHETYARTPAPPPAARDIYRGEYIGPIRIGDPNVFWPGVAASAAMTGTYFAIRNHQPLRVPGDGRFNTGAFALTTVGCMALAPMFAAAVTWGAEQRPLSSREAMGLGAGCIIPIIGPLLMDAAFDAHPEWENR
jgi:hypothetical protein